MSKKKKIYINPHEHVLFWEHVFWHLLYIFFKDLLMLPYSNCCGEEDELFWCKLELNPFYCVQIRMNPLDVKLNCFFFYLLQLHVTMTMFGLHVVRTNVHALQDCNQIMFKFFSIISISDQRLVPQNTKLWFVLTVVDYKWYSRRTR